MSERFAEIAVTPTCDVKGCDERPVTLVVEPGIYVCTRHDRGRRVVCRYCAVPIYGDKDTRAVLPHLPHVGGCPRRIPLPVPPETAGTT